jgi:hypothetical protein
VGWASWIIDFFLLPDVVAAAKRTKAWKNREISALKILVSFFLATVLGSLLVVAVYFAMITKKLSSVELEVEQRIEVVLAAQKQAKKKISYDSQDCSGLVKNIYSIFLGRKDIMSGNGNGVARIFEFCKKNHYPISAEKPRAGDLVFWDGTTQENKPFSHVGIVEGVFPDGTFLMLHSSEGGDCACASGAKHIYIRNNKMGENFPGQVRGFAFIPPARTVAHE